MIRDDRRVNVDWKVECGQLNLAHVTGNKKYKRTKTNKRQYLLSSAQDQKLWRNQKDYGGKDLWKRWVFLSPEWKVEGVTDGESEGGDCDEVMHIRWSESGGEWTEWGWWNEEESWFHRKGDAYVKEQLVSDLYRWSR